MMNFKCGYPEPHCRIRFNAEAKVKFPRNCSLHAMVNPTEMDGSLNPLEGGSVRVWKNAKI